MANFNVTLAGQYITPLITPEQVNDFSVRYDVPYSILQVATSTTSGDTVTLLLGTTPTTWVAGGAMAYVASSFSGTSVTSISVAFGTTTNSTCFLASTNVCGVSNGLTIAPTNGINTVNTFANAQATSSVQMAAVVTIQGSGGANGISSGFMQLFVDVRDNSQPY